MALTTVSFTTNFNASTGLITITDTTNYAGAGVALTDVVGVLAITDPTDSQYYNNTDYNNPDVTPNTSLVQSTEVSIAEADDEYLVGEYTLDYTVKVDNGVDPVYYVTESVVVDFNYCSPEINIGQTANCVAPLFTSSDNTTYTVNGITPTITRSHSLYYPPGSSLYLIPTTTTGATINAYSFYTGPQTTIIESTLSYDYGSGFTIDDVIQGQKTTIVDCDGVCAVYCCMKALETRRTNAKGVNKTLYEKYTNTLNICMSLMSLAKFSLECGENEDAQGYMDKILVLSECNDDCGCGNDGTPQLVTGLSTTGSIDLPWTLVNNTTNDNAILNIGGANVQTINSISALSLKYKKVGTMAQLNWSSVINVTRNGANTRLIIETPTSMPLTNAPYTAIGQAFLVNQTTGEMITIGVIGSTIGLGSYYIPTAVIPSDGVAYTYAYSGSITYETTV